jgi:hypothetical protein
VTWLWWLWPLGGPVVAWPQIMPNIVASILCGAVVWLWGRRHLKRLHARHDEHDKLLRRALGEDEEDTRG